MSEDHSILSKIESIHDPEVDRENGLPNRKEIINLLKEVQLILFPKYYRYYNMSQLQAYEELEMSLEKQIRETDRILGEGKRNAAELTKHFLSQLPEIKRVALTDIQAIYDGDPAAKSKAEIILCYPGFYAILIYRIAHVLYAAGIPYISRVMTEYAHEKTGIDINPGATIGDYFCIDHGTGIVVGETATIGHHVKLYQGVTIGARSFALDAEGKPIKDGKRHPDIGDHVIIYANATILGGDTKIGNHCVVGGNVWLLHSLADYEKIYYRE